MNEFLGCEEGRGEGRKEGRKDTRIQDLEDRGACLYHLAEMYFCPSGGRIETTVDCAFPQGELSEALNHFIQVRHKQADEIYLWRRL